MTFSVLTSLFTHWLRKKANGIRKRICVFFIKLIFIDLHVKIRNIKING